MDNGYNLAGALPGLPGVFASYAFIKILRHGAAYKMFCWFGLATMDIYVAYQMFMRASFGTGWVRVVSASVAGVLLPLALSFLVLRRSRILSALLLGKRQRGGTTKAPGDPGPFHIW